MPSFSNHPPRRRPSRQFDATSFAPGRIAFLWPTTRTNAARAQKMHRKCSWGWNNFIGHNFAIFLDFKLTFGSKKYFFSFIWLHVHHTVHVLSCVKAFLLSFENHSVNVPLPTPKLHYGAIQCFSQPFPKPGRNVVYTTLYILASSTWRSADVNTW